MIVWTRHSEYKLRQYGLSKQRINRVIRRPDRIEAGIVPNMIAAMQIAGSKSRRYEIWTMYGKRGGTMRILSAWKYPGTSPERDPVPREILEEMRGISMV